MYQSIPYGITRYVVQLPTKEEWVVVCILLHRIFQVPMISWREVRLVVVDEVRDGIDKVIVRCVTHNSS